MAEYLDKYTGEKPSEKFRCDSLTPNFSGLFFFFFFRKSALQSVTHLFSSFL